MRRLEFDNPDRRYDAIADAHNAALAATGLKKLFDEMTLNKQLRKQLAAERGKPV